MSISFPVTPYRKQAKENTSFVTWWLVRQYFYNSSSSVLHNNEIKVKWSEDSPYGTNDCLKGALPLVLQEFPFHYLEAPPHHLTPLWRLFQVIIIVSSHRIFPNQFFGIVHWNHPHRRWLKFIRIQMPSCQMSSSVFYASKWYQCIDKFINRSGQV